MSRRLFSLGLAVLLGFIVAVYPAFHVAAESYMIFFGPPTAQTDGASSYLDDDWHLDAKSLDWDGNVGYTTYSRAWAISPDQSPQPRAQGELYVGQDYYNCENVVWLDIYDTATNTWQASVGYVHTDSPQFTGRINYSFSSSEVYNGAVATAIMTDGDTCTWDGEHVHETHWDGGAASHKGINYLSFAGNGIAY